MISKMIYTCVYVLDQESAKEFYINKLGFEIRTNAPLENGVSWLTVAPKEQPGFEITLMPITEGMMFDKQAAEQMRNLVRRGTFGFGVFECNDIFATYEELKAKGVVLPKNPEKRFMERKPYSKTIRATGFHLFKKILSKNIPRCKN